MKVLDEYEINSATCAIIYVDESCSKVVEDDFFFVRKSALEIINHSCIYFGSSYKGRCDGAKSLLGISYKVPIIIEEVRKSIFFPTGSTIAGCNCSWISLNKISKYEKCEGCSKLVFDNNIEEILPISYYSLQNQIFRSTMLASVLKKREEIR